MEKRLFKKGDIVVCIDPAGDMYSKVDQLEYGKTYKIHGYKNDPELYTNIYLEKWNGFGGNYQQNNGNCSFLEERFILRSTLTEELVFKITKHKLGIEKVRPT